MKKFKIKDKMSTALAGSSNLSTVDSDRESCYNESNKHHSKKQKIYISDDEDNEIEFEDDINVNYNQIESEDNETTFEEEDSEIDEESEFENGFGDIEDTSKWMLDGDFRQFLFKGNTALKCPTEGSNPYDFFKLFVDDNFFSTIVAETNKYAESKMGDRFKKLSVIEFRIFLGLLLHMGTIKSSNIQDYWSTHRLFNLKCFSQHMSRNRFQDILRSLHFASSNGSNNRLSEIRPIIDYFNDKMRVIYYPCKVLVIRKKMVPWRDRLTLRYDIAGKRHKNNVKSYVLTDSSGIALRIKVCGRGEDDISDKEHATEIVLHLLEDFLQNGHSIFMDDFLISFALCKRLLDSKTHCTGALRKFQNENSEEVVKEKLSKGEVTSRYKNNIMMGMFRDKKDILFISSEYKSNLVEIENHRKEKVKKPLVLHKFNKFMNEIVKNDQMLSYYTCSRKTFKWYIKLWINIVETLLLNSFFLYSRYALGTRKFNLFRLDVIDNLLFDDQQENTSIVLPDLEHTPEVLPRGKDNKVKRKRCRQCFANNIRKGTNYSCTACDGNPGLCLGTCFREYHRQK